MVSLPEPGATSFTETLEALREARFGHSLRCLHCRHRGVHRWGSFSGRQRFRCTRCLRTFSDFTGTPAAGLKKVELLTSYGACLAQSISLRAAAARVGIHLSTAFRWRHRFLDGLRSQDVVTVKGQVELRLDWFAESRKGERSGERPPRRRGVRYRTFGETPGVIVVAACDRTGGVVTVQLPHLVSPYRPPPADRLEAAMAARIEPDSVLVAGYGPLSPFAILARRLRVEFRDARPPPLRRGSSRDDLFDIHIQTVTKYIRQLRGWLRDFRGVATKYLRNYLIWHRWTGLCPRRGFASPWLWPVL